MKNGTRLILGATMSMVGSWVSLTAILIDFQSRGGPFLVTLYLFFLTLTPALLARPILIRIKRYAIGNIWFFSESCQAALVLIMAVFIAYTPILLFLVSILSVLQNIAASTQMSLVSKKVPESDQDGVLTAISSGSSLSLVIGPAFGGVLVGWLGLQAVFVLQAFCYVCAVAIVPWSHSGIETIKRSPSRGMSSYRPPRRTPEIQGCQSSFCSMDNICCIRNIF